MASRTIRQSSPKITIHHPRWAVLFNFYYPTINIGTRLIPPTKFGHFFLRPFKITLLSTSVKLLHKNVSIPQHFISNIQNRTHFLLSSNSLSVKNKIKKKNERQNYPVRLFILTNQKKIPSLFDCKFVCYPDVWLVYYFVYSLNDIKSSRTFRGWEKDTRLSRSSAKLTELVDANLLNHLSIQAWPVRRHFNRQRHHSDPRVLVKSRVRAVIQQLSQGRHAICWYTLPPDLSEPIVRPKIDIAPLFLWVRSRTLVILTIRAPANLTWLIVARLSRFAVDKSSDCYRQSEYDLFPLFFSFCRSLFVAHKEKTIF